MKHRKEKPIYSTGYKKYIRRQRFDTFFVVLIQLTLLALFITLWEVLARTHVIDPFIFSSPSRIYETIKMLIKTGVLWHHVGITVLEVVIGFTVSTVLGTLFAILLYQSSYLRRILEPYLVVLNALPKVALGPMIIIWFGAGMQAIIVMCVLICVFLTTISMLSAFMAVDEGKIMLMRTMQANRFQVLAKLVLPASFPSLMTVLKVNVGLAWVGTIMGEYLVSSAGLGYLIIYGGTVFRLDLVMASVTVLCILAAIMYFAVAYLEKLVKRARR